MMVYLKRAIFRSRKKAEDIQSKHAQDHMLLLGRKNALERVAA